MEIQYGNLDQLQYVWLIAICWLTAIFALYTTARLRRRFATTNLLPRILPASGRRQLIGGTLAGSLSILLLIFALTDVRWGKVWREVPQTGIELMFVLDVSRSMLAEDVTPSRLSRAKQQISDTIDELAGDRIGLVVFAGQARQLIPMTSHYDDFKQSLQSVDTNSVRRGGSRLGDAIRVATEGFLSKTNDHKAMMILTDGEDQESTPLAASKQAFDKHGVRIFTIGLGDLEQGARIPIRSEQSRSYLQHEGQQVWSKLNGKVLAEIATTTDGAYIPAGTKRVNMADVYHNYIANVEQQEFESAKINSYAARYQWFVGPALLLVLLDIFWPVIRARRSRASSFAPEKAPVSRQRDSRRRRPEQPVGRSHAVGGGLV